MKWIILLSCFLFNIVDGAVNERFGKIDEEYGLSYVEGLNHYIYDPRIVSPYIDLKDNSGTIINAEGVMIQGEGGKTHFELKYDHCAPNTKDVFYTCICFELKDHNPDDNNAFCDGRPLMAVCKRSDDSSKFYVVDDKGHRDVFSKDLYFDWSLKQLKVGNENHDLKFEKHLPLNGQTSRTMDINTEGIEGFRVFSSYRGERIAYDGKAERLLVTEIRKCTSYTFKNGIFMGQLLGDQLNTTDRIISENGTTNFEPTLATIANLSCSRYEKYCGRFCEDQKIEVRAAPTGEPQHLSADKSGTNGNFDIIGTLGIGIIGIFGWMGI